MLHRVFHQRLQRQRRHIRVLKSFRDRDLITQTLSEARLLDLQIVADDFEFLAEWRQAALIGVEREAQQRGKFADRIFGQLRIPGNQRGDGVERVEKKVGMDARFERREPRLGQQLVSALLLHLARAQFERGRLELVAQSLKGRDAQANHE